MKFLLLLNKSIKKIKQFFEKTKNYLKIMIIFFKNLMLKHHINKNFKSHIIYMR